MRTLGRLDEVIVFRPLREDDVRAIAEAAGGAYN